MNLISLSIRRPVFAWILMSALIIFGAICANRLGVSQLPDIDFPVLSVSVTYEGASPEVVESELIEPIEERLLGIEGIKQMRSSVRQGSGTVTLDLDIKRNVDIALQEVQAALSQLRFPPGIDPPVIRKTNPEDQPIMFLGVVSNKPLREALNWTDTFLLDQFRFLPGVGEVSIGGFSERNLRIWPDPKKMRALDLTVLDLVNAIQSQHLESAAGQFIMGERELRVRWLGEAMTPEEVGNIRLLRRGGEVIHNQSSKGLFIKDVARVEDGLSDIRRMVRIDGKEAIGIGIRKQRGENEVAIARAVRAKVEELKPVMPEGYEVRVNVDFTKPTETVVHTTYEKLIVAAIVTIFVCFLFLGSWQAAVNVLFSIPTSIIGTFTILYFSGFTLNLFTLLALTLAISIVVDDAIMLLENIVRHARMGKPKAQAAYDGSVEILPAAVAATLAVIAVFLPVVFMEGVIGKFFFQFGVTMSAAVFLSLIEAVTITPMRASVLLSSASNSNRFERWLEHVFGKLSQSYTTILGKTLRFPKTVVVSSIVVFILSLVLVRGVRQEFVPMQDQDLIIVSGQAPPGSSLEHTESRAKEVENVLKQNENVTNYFVSIGAGGPSAEVNQFFIPTYLKPRETRRLTHVQVMDQLREKFKQVKGVRVSMRDNSTRGLTSGRRFPVSFNLIGSDLNVLEEKSEQIMARLDQEGLTQDLDTDFKMGLPELLIRPNRLAMAKRGVSVDAVALTLGATVAGARQSRFTADGRRYDMRIKLLDEELNSPKDIQGILVRNSYGNSIPLDELVTLQETKTYQSINRVNRQRAIGVFGNVKTGQSQAGVLKRAEEIAREILPIGYSFSLEGASAGLTESFKSLTGALALGVLVAYMILAVQFNSFIHPVSILMALPFSVTGALLILWLTGTSLNLFSFIGLIVLMGIAKKNSILLVEFTNQVRTRGMSSVKDALIKACPIRLRPILMTSVATLAAAGPLIFGNSIGQETRTPMGLTIIGGTIVSTALTLFVVPCIYLLLSKFESRKKIDLTT
ncbi:MAG: efflux RND transporter permease subunit [Bdellovibrionota bacterium]